MCVVLTLVARLVGSASEGAPLASSLADCLRCAYRSGNLQCPFRTEAVVGQKQALRHQFRRRPRFLGNPTSRQFLMEGSRLHAVCHPGAQHGLIHHAGIKALEPVVPPPQHFLQEADLRTRKCKVWISMCPGSDETFARYTETLKEPRDRVRIAIGPSANDTHRTLDRTVVLAHRPPLPVAVAALVLQPC